MIKTSLTILFKESGYISTEFIESKGWLFQKFSVKLPIQSLTSFLPLVWCFGGKLQLTGVSTERGSLLFRKKDRIPRPPEIWCRWLLYSSTENHCKNKNQTKPLHPRIEPSWKGCKFVALSDIYLPLSPIEANNLQKKASSFNFKKLFRDAWPCFALPMIPTQENSLQIVSSANTLQINCKKLFRHVKPPFK